VFAFPFLHSFALFVTVATLFGLFIAAYISTTSVILVDLVGIDKLTTSFGLITMFRGTAAVIGPPIAGAVFESTESFTASFVMAGSFFLAAGLLRQMDGSPLYKILSLRIRFFMNFGNLHSDPHQNKFADVSTFQFKKYFLFPLHCTNPLENLLVATRNYNNNSDQLNYFQEYNFLAINFIW